MRSVSLRLICLVGLLWLPGCGRVGVELLTEALDGAVLSCTNDADGDGAPDCNDFCPGAQDRREDGTTQRGTGTTPASATSIPAGRAAGGSGDCGAGGNGYATITFVP